jgi:hypothetical protein
MAIWEERRDRMAAQKVPPGHSSGIPRKLVVIIDPIGNLASVSGW